MRALRSERLLAFEAAPSRTVRGRSAGRGAHRTVPKRRKPPPRWRRPALLATAAIAGVLIIAAAAYALWAGGALDAAGAWTRGSWLRAQVAAGLVVDEVVLTGRQGTPRDEVLRALSVRRGEPLLAIDAGAIKARLEAIGWVRSARVARKLPDRLEIEIRERVPLALWQRQGRLVLIGGDGAVITGKELGRYRDLPIVIGEGAPARAAELLAALGQEPALLERVTAAVWVGGRRWNVRLRDGIEVRLPEGGEAIAWSRLAALDRKYRILARDLVRIDMRLADRLIVRLAPGSAARLRDPGEKT